MTAGAHTRTLIAKEARALLPGWIACVAAATAASLTAGPMRDRMLVAFAAAAIGLGAQSVGHEYSPATVGLMLTLPVHRARLFLAKMCVLAAMVLPLAAYASQAGMVPRVPALPWLFAAGALCLAPSLTMLTRNPLAGAVLAMSVPGTLFTSVTLATGAAWSGSAEAERAAVAIWLRLMIPLLVAGAALGWRQFMRLEVFDGGATEIHLTWRTRTRRDARPANPVWQLVKKELRLQQLTMAMTALFLFTLWPTLLVLRLSRMNDDVAFAGAAISWLCVPVLVGALAAAGERQLGTLAWQLQLPTPAWQQWGTKVATIFGLALALAVGVPVPIAHLIWPTEPVAVGAAIVVVVVLTAASLYISSLCATGVRAAVASLVVLPIVLWLIVTLVMAISPATVEFAFWRGRESGWLALLAVVVALLVRFAFVNHRPEPPPIARIWKQAIALAAVIGLGVVLLR